MDGSAASCTSNSNTSPARTRAICIDGGGALRVRPPHGEGHLIPAVDTALLLATHGALCTVVATPATVARVRTHRRLGLTVRLEAVLKEKSGELAFPRIRQVFMPNNTHAIVRRAVRSNLAMFLPPGWARAREEHMEGYVKSYLDMSWAPIVSRLAAGAATAAATKPAAVSVLRRQ
uniref:Exocyst subunit Exo70 family protein n=3 Tax=Oryza TaxID=4527 RepID=A0A0D3ESP0_9ORYZ